MRFFLFKAISGVLALAAMAVSAQTAAPPATPTLTLTVEDSSGAPIAGAHVQDSSGHAVGTAGSDGRIEVPCKMPCQYAVNAPGFASTTVAPTEGLQADGGHAEMVVQLKPAGDLQQITVTAYRAPLGELESPAVTRRLSETALQTSAAVTMDGQVRQLPGVELFRRSSSLVANPSSQGVSLRGLGSTSASRTLVTADDVPLNDPVGAWIHWEEEPALAVNSIEVARGGASDLYGSSAIGGVVNVRLAQPTDSQFQFSSSYGGDATYEDSLLAQAKHGPWGGLLASTLLGTDGYIQEAPFQRGPIDQPSNVHAQNLLLIADHHAGALRLFARGSGFNEERHNGTPYQINGTHLWRYASGADWDRPQGARATLRIYGSAERYDQTFSSVSNTPTAADPSCTYRCSEVPSRFALIPDNELGAALHWSQPLTPGLLFLAGADTHDVRVWDNEQTFGATAALTHLHVHQRDSAPWVEAVWIHRAWTLTASAREDWFQNYDTQQLQFTASGWTPTATQPPQFDQRVFDPRLGLSRKLGDHWSVSGSGFRAFRAPSPSELYRSTQVGNQLTKPNGSLLSERATGWEAGLATDRRWGAVRTSWFDTQINRPISAVTINPNSSPILLLRENLGQIESRGVSLDFELASRRGLSVDGGYQYAHATVTRGTPLNIQDVGKWIPEVARNMATLNLHASRPRYGTLSLQSRISGHMFDDDANTYLLHGYFRLDAYASHDFGSRLQLFAAGENLFDRTIEVAKTPTTTLAMPRVARGGFLVKLDRAAK
jgi:outer membrane receptor protein involved in Fe transport